MSHPDPPHNGTDSEARDNKTGDEKLLASIGYAQEFKRDFTPLELFGLGFSTIGVLPSISAVLFYSIPYAGPAGLVWGWFVCSFFLMFIALAMAELGSSAPTCGGIYYWTFKFSSERYRNYLCWIVGYINAVTYIAGVAGVHWGCAVQVMAAASISTDGTFVPTVYQIYGVFVALVVCQTIICSSATKSVARLHLVYIVTNVALALAVIVGLPAAAPPEVKNSASYAFGHFENLYPSWPNGFAFILSFLAPLWVVGGFDSTVHISEEARNANVAVPWAIISAIGVSCVLGFAINISLAFNMGSDLVAIVSSPFGQPLATILFGVFGKKGTLILWSFVIIAQYMVGTSLLTSSSRQLFAFSRDGALPLSRILYKVNKSFVPVRCVATSAFASILLTLIALAGPAASGAIFAIGVVGQYTANTIVISSRWLGPHEFKPGPFSLGSMSALVSAVAVAFMTVMLVILLFPVAPEVTPATMNYTVLVLGATVLFSTLYYALDGRHWFKGPVVTVDSGDGHLHESSSGAGSHLEKENH